MRFIDHNNMDNNLLYKLNDQLKTKRNKQMKHYQCYGYNSFFALPKRTFNSTCLQRTQNDKT